MSCECRRLKEVQGKYSGLKFFSLHSKPLGYLDLYASPRNCTNVAWGFKLFPTCEGSASQEEREEPCDSMAPLTSPISSCRLQLTGQHSSQRWRCSVRQMEESWNTFFLFFLSTCRFLPRDSSLLCDLSRTGISVYFTEHLILWPKKKGKPCCVLRRKIIQPCDAVKFRPKTSK